MRTGVFPAHRRASGAKGCVLTTWPRPAEDALRWGVRMVAAQAYRLLGDGAAGSDAAAPSGGRDGGVVRVRARPGKVHADKVTTGRPTAHLRRREIRPGIARRGIESSLRLGGIAGRSRVGVMAELLAAAWMRWDRDSGRWFAFVPVACAVVCFNRLLTRQKHDTTA